MKFSVSCQSQRDLKKNGGDGRGKICIDNDPDTNLEATSGAINKNFILKKRRVIRQRIGHY